MPVNSAQFEADNTTLTAKDLDSDDTIDGVPRPG